jgi:ABC-type transporter Mla maintaining outer membrane lipid asymmetry ATPase subunit MlaF
MNSKNCQKTFLGYSKGKLIKKKEYLSTSQLNHHVHVVGASGYGKSVLLSKIIKGRIETGEGLISLTLRLIGKQSNKFRDSVKRSTEMVISICSLFQTRESLRLIIR